MDALQVDAGRRPGADPRGSRARCRTSCRHRVAYTPGYARVSRALVLDQGELVRQGRAFAGRQRISDRAGFTWCPTSIAPLFILMAMDIPCAIAVESGLSFLGLGVRPPTPIVGRDPVRRVHYVYNDAWAIVWATAALMVATSG